MVVNGGQKPEGSDVPLNGVFIFSTIQKEQKRVQSFYSESITIKRTEVRIYGGSAQSQQAASPPAKVTTVAKDSSVSKADAGTSSGVNENYSLSLIRKLFGDDMACLCGCLNHLLSSSSLAAPYLPLKEDNVFDKLQDGVVLCATVNALPGGTLDESQVHRSADLTDAELGEMRCLQNLNLALKSLEPLGLFTEAIEGRNLRGGRALLISGILLQIVRVNTHRRMRSEYNSNLLYIMDDWSSDDAAKLLDAMPQEEVLTRWVNYQLRKAGTDLVLQNFGSSLADSVIYSTLLNTVAPAAKKSSLRSMDDIMLVKDLVLRATFVVNNAEILGISDVITPEHIATAGKGPAMQSARNCIINMAFLGRIFASFPSIEVPAQAAQKSTKSPSSDPKQEPNKEHAKEKRTVKGPGFQFELSQSNDRGASEETLMMWLNSFGVNPIVYNLETDLRSGIVLQQVWKAMAPSYTKWGKFYEVNDPNVSKRKFQWLANCTAVMECAKHHGIKVNCSASDIATGETKNTLALVFLMMRMHSQIRRRQVCGDSVGDLDDGALVKWVNERLVESGSSFQLKDLRDPGLVSTNALGFLGERVLVEAGRFRNASTGGGGGSRSQQGGGGKKATSVRRTASESSSSDSRCLASPEGKASRPSPSTPTPPPPPQSPPPSPSPPPQKQQQGYNTSTQRGRTSSQSSSESATAHKASQTSPPPPPPPPPQKQQQESKANRPQHETLSASEEEAAAAGAAVIVSKKLIHSTVGGQSSGKQSQTQGGGQQKREFTSFSQSSTSSHQSFSSTTERSEKTVTKTTHTFRSNNRNAATTVCGANASWLFPSLTSLPSSAKDMEKYSATAITMFRRSGVSVFASLLGPGTDTSVYRDVLLQLNALCK